MNIATPFSLRWERAQDIDRSAIEPLGPTLRPEKKCSPRRSAGERLWPTFSVTPPPGYKVAAGDRVGDIGYWDGLVRHKSGCSLLIQRHRAFNRSRFRAILDLPFEGSVS